ncbi:hypothetical protein FGW37_29530 [Streptomyces rectiverticillatus]|uniref:DUF5955 family protein n=1 Tax=Streptomyces rectiverticillatus TaxID=173860 RepID=UPI0015C3705B|nr:DUF5955 family protein [Streptomyces rectiverticillatus]QLE75193.1 hypothetical protein FGW37_29530 [Streptomyces rectiverticillatus]
MTSTRRDGNGDAPRDHTRGIVIHGTFSGNAQTGDHAGAEYVHHAAGSGGRDAESAEVRELRQAVEALRAQLASLPTGSSGGGLPSPAVQAAQAALDEVDDALPTADEPARGRIQRAVYAVTGALASAASLAEGVRALREAAAPWF